MSRKLTQAGELVFLGAHSAANADGSVEHPGDAEAQARVAFERLIGSLEDAGGSAGDLVDVVSFNLDARDIPAALAVGRELLPAGAEPAWTAVTMTGATTPGVLFVLRGIAVLGDAEKRCITPEGSWWSDMPASAVCRKGDLAFVSGQLAVGDDGAVLEPGSHGGQAREGLRRVGELAELAGGSLDDLLDMVSFHQDPRGMGEVADAWEEAFDGVPPSAAAPLTTIGVPGLYARGLIGQYRAILDLSPGERIGRVPDSVWWKNMPISGVTKKESGKLVGIAGQVSSDGEGEILHWGDARAQASYCLEQIGAGLELLGGSLADVVEVTAFHKDIRDADDVAAAAREALGDRNPAWTSVGTTGLYQEGYLHEIHALAVIE